MSFNIYSAKRKIGYRCVLNVAVGGWFPKGQDRLRDGLHGLDGTANFAAWKDCYPKDSPTHQIAPYAFKCYAINWARKAEYKTILWLDASMVILKNLEPLWQEIDEKGHMFVLDGTAASAWISDRALKKMGRTRDDVDKVPLIFAGCMGFNLEKPESIEFLERWERWTMDPDINHAGTRMNVNGIYSKDPRCKGHGYDQTPASIIRHDMGLSTTPYGKYMAFFDEAMQRGSFIAGAGF